MTFLGSSTGLPVLVIWVCRSAILEEIASWSEDNAGDEALDEVVLRLRWSRPAKRRLRLGLLEDIAHH